MKECKHKFIDTGRVVTVFRPQFGYYFEEELKNSYRTTHLIDISREDYKILECKYCGEEIEEIKINLKERK